MLNVLASLLPRGARAWHVMVDKPLRRLLRGLSMWISDAQQYIASVFFQLDPQRTTELSRWEFDVGLSERAGLTDQERRDRLQSQLAAERSQAIGTVQDTIRAAGFDVYVHDSIRFCAEFRSASSVIELVYPTYIGLNFTIRARFQAFTPNIGFSPQPILSGSGIEVGVQDGWLTLSVAKAAGGFETHLLIARVYEFDTQEMVFTRAGDTFNITYAGTVYEGSTSAWASAFNIAYIGGTTFRGQIRDVITINDGVMYTWLPLNGDTTNYATGSTTVANATDIVWPVCSGPITRGEDMRISPTDFIVNSTDKAPLLDQARYKFYFATDSLITAASRVWDPDAADDSFDFRFTFDTTTNGTIISQTNGGAAEFRVYISGGGNMFIVLGGTETMLMGPAFTAQRGLGSWRLTYNGVSTEIRKNGALLTNTVTPVGATREPAAPTRLGVGITGELYDLRFEDSAGEVLNMPVSDGSGTTIANGGTLTAGHGWWRYDLVGGRGYPLVNKIKATIQSTRAAMGEPDMQMGETFAQMGEYRAYQEKTKTYNVPMTVASDAWAHFVYVGGVNFPSFATVPAARRDEFESLILRLIPGHVWTGALIEYEE